MTKLHYKTIRALGCALVWTFLIVGVRRSMAEATDEAALPRSAPKVLDLSGLVCFWDFQEVGGQLRWSRGPHDYPLREQFGKIARVQDGVWGPYSARIEPRQWLSIDRADCPALDIRGAGAKYTILACFSYATGATRLEEDRWYFLAATYDQQSLKMYVDGKLDTLSHCNPFVYPDKPIFDGGEDGANFTVAQRAIPQWKGYPNTPYPDERQGFSGQIGGLAVYDRALNAEQVATIHAAVEARKLGNDCERPPEPWTTSGKLGAKNHRSPA